MECVTFPRNREILDKVDPDMQTFMKWFLALTETPHQTFDSQKLIDKICVWITSLGVEYQRDTSGNIVCRIPANDMSESTSTIAIQAHTDMITVGEFESDGSVKVSLKDNDLIVAEKSTLGADDGVGVALMLEMLEYRDKFPHGPMEFIFTADEEIGCTGVQKLPKADGTTKSAITPLQCKYLINCDALASDKIYVCANGGIISNVTMQIHPESVGSEESIISMDIKGLKGGHSGGCIGLGRLSAIKALTRIMCYLQNNKISFRICDIHGGEMINIIPCFASASIALSADDVSRAQTLITQCETEIVKEHEASDNVPDFQCSVRSATAEDKCISIDETRKLLNYMLCVHDGALRMSPIFANAVDMSSNMGIVTMNPEEVKFETFRRSVLKSKLDQMGQMEAALCEMSGLVYRIEYVGSIPPWSPKTDSRLAKLVSESFQKLHGISKPYGLLQVTIEAPVFSDLLGYDVDMVSICPDIPKAHSVGEFVSIKECRQWKQTIYDVISNI